jgi:histidyl-tRNA synthetase
MTEQKCKGARDLLPQDTERFRFIEDTFRRSCLSWSYQEVKTPTLEYLHLFTAAGTLTPSMLSKVYSFLDWDGWSGERVALRPDGTIPVARLFIENLAQQEIARLFYVTNVFIFEETGKKNREKWQCGAEFLGNFKPTADIELILLAIEVIRSLRIGNVELKLSHAGLLKALIQELNLAPEEKHALLDQIQDGNWQTLTQTKTSNADINKMLSLLLDLKGKSSGFLENLKALPQISAESKSQLEKFMEITSLLDMLGCRYQIDITSTKGFEYYTGLCFQLSVNQERVGSGGRYDNLIPLIGGSNTPACGFALYLDPLIDMIPPKAQENTEKKVLIRIKSITPNVVKTGFQIAQSFREVGYIAELDFNNRKPNYRWVITVEDKLSTFTITDQTKNLNKELSSISDAIKMLGGSV